MECSNCYRACEAAATRRVAPTSAPMKLGPQGQNPSSEGFKRPWPPLIKMDVAALEADE
jgi:hypothetical protein